MANLALGVPVMKNFKGFTKLMGSVDYPVLPLVHNNWDYNDGVAAGWNNLMQRAVFCGVSTLIIANDDVQFAPGTIEKMYGWFTNSPEIDLLSGANHNADTLEFVEGVKADYSCFMVRPHLFVPKFGWFDEKFTPAYFEDDDMHYRIKVLGGTEGLLQTARIYHEGSATQFFDGEENRVVSHDQFRDNRQRYVAKWGGTPKDEAYTVPFNGITGKTAKDW